LKERLYNRFESKCYINFYIKKIRQKKRLELDSSLDFTSRRASGLRPPLARLPFNQFTGLAKKHDLFYIKFCFIAKKNY
jgi:hypothetical protein